MNWARVAGEWHQIAGHVKSNWGKLTDDDIKAVDGKREQLVGKLQQLYGILRDDAEGEIDRWLAHLGRSANASGKPNGARQVDHGKDSST